VKQKVALKGKKKKNFVIKINRKSNDISGDYKYISVEILFKNCKNKYIY
jgi:hypothetical protein